MNQAVDNLGNNQLTSVNVLNTTYAYTVFMRADIAISEGEQLHIRAPSYMGGRQSEHLKKTEGYAGGPAPVALYMSAMVSFQHLDMWLYYCMTVSCAGRKCWNCLCGPSLRAATPYIMWKLPTTLGPGIASEANNIHESQQPPASNLSAGPCRYFAVDHQRDRHAFILRLSRSQDCCRLCVSAKAKLSLAPGTGLSTSSEGAS